MLKNLLFSVITGALTTVMYDGRMGLIAFWLSLITYILVDVYIEFKRLNDKPR